MLGNTKSVWILSISNHRTFIIKIPWAMGATCCWILSRPGYNYLGCKVQAGRQHPCRRRGRVRGCSCPDQSRYRGEVQRGSLSLANFIHHSAEAQLPLAITYESQQSAHPSPPALTFSQCYSTAETTPGHGQCYYIPVCTEVHTHSWSGPLRRVIPRTQPQGAGAPGSVGKGS